jgi:hypothetical protein
MRSYSAGGCVAYLGWLVESRNSPLVTSSQKSLALIVSNLDFSAARADEDCGDSSSRSALSLQLRRTALSLTLTCR